MVNVQNLREDTGLQTESIGNQRTLEVSHTRLPLPDAAVKRVEGFMSESVNPARHIAAIGRLHIVESRYLAMRIGRNPQRTFIVHVFGHSHQAVNILTKAQLLNKLFEFVFPENGVNSGHTALSLCL